MSETSRERIARALSEAPVGRRSRPIGASILYDSRHVADFFDRYYHPEEGSDARPGLAEMGLASHLGADLRGLVTEAEAVALALAAEAPAPPVARMRVVLRELETFLRWEAGRTPAIAPALAALREAHGRSRRPDAVVVALEHFAMLAREHEGPLRTIPAFPAGLLDEAEALVRAPLVVPTDRVAAERRNAAIATVLDLWRYRILRAADVVFRHHPAVAREARSAREHDRVARSVRTRRARRAGDEPAPDVPEVPAVPA